MSSMTVKRARRSSQQERVLLARPKIIEFMKLRVTLSEIQKRIGLEDIPYSTFHYHASKLGPDAEDPAYRTDKAGPGGDRTSTDNHALPPSPPVAKPVEEKDEPPAQRKSVVPVKVVLDEPGKKARPRRKGGRVSPDLSVKKDEFDTSKWSSELK